MKKIPLILSGAIFFLISCDKEEDLTLRSIEFMPKALHLEYGDRQNLYLEVQPHNAVIDSLIWRSSDKRVVSIDSNLIECLKTGVVEIFVSTPDNKISDTCRVAVDPTNYLYEEPVLKFGSSKETISDNEPREIYDESQDGLAFVGENERVRYALYIFDNNKMTSCAILFQNTTFVVNELADFVKQRYFSDGSDNDVYFFTRNGVSVGVGIDDDLGLYAIYTPVNESGGRRSAINLGKLEQLHVGLN